MRKIDLSVSHGPWSVPESFQAHSNRAVMHRDRHAGIRRVSWMTGSALVLYDPGDKCLKIDAEDKCLKMTRHRSSPYPYGRTFMPVSASKACATPQAQVGDGADICRCPAQSHPADGGRSFLLLRNGSVSCAHF